MARKTVGAPKAIKPKRIGTPRPNAGAPSKYKPEYCQAVIDDMSQGYSLTAFAGGIGVDRRTITEWCDVHPEFSLAVTRAKAARLRNWEQVAIQMRTNGGGRGGATITVFGLKNMGGDEWSAPEKHEHTGKDGGAIESKVEVSPDAAFADLIAKLDGVARGATANIAAPGGLAGDSEAVPASTPGK